MQAVIVQPRPTETLELQEHILKLSQDFFFNSADGGLLYNRNMIKKLKDDFILQGNITDSELYVLVTIHIVTR